MQKTLTLSSSLGVFLLLIEALKASPTIVNCPSPDQINIENNYPKEAKEKVKEGVTFAWNAPDSPPKTWSGQGGTSPGPLQSAKLFVIHNDSTLVQCTYQNGNLGTTIPNICVFKSKAKECSGEDCAITCYPVSEIAQLSGSCKGAKIGPGTPYPCFDTFENQLIIDNKFTVTISAPDCEIGDAINAKFKNIGHSICMKGTFNGSFLNVLQSLPTFSLQTSWMRCGDTNVTFFLPTDGKCSQ